MDHVTPIVSETEFADETTYLDVCKTNNSIL